jgi:hypothetical protein
MTETPPIEVLLDNFTLQGAYGRVSGTGDGRAYDQCLAHLTEALVLYDRLFVPADVLNRNDACRYIADRLSGVLEGRSLGTDDAKTPEIHHHVIEMSVVEQFQPLLWDKNPFAQFPEGQILEIERIGHQGSPPGYMGRGETHLTFPERQTYYTWFCIRLASALGVSYAPNPMRVPLVTMPEFQSVPVVSTVASDVMGAFEQVRKQQSDRIGEVFKSLKPSVELPLIFNYLMSKSGGSVGILDAALELRESKPAAAFRAYCRELTTADVGTLLERRQEIEDLVRQWSNSLSSSRKTKTWSFSWFIGTDFKTPWFNLKALDRKPHFLFLHSLLSTAPAG